MSGQEIFAAVMLILNGIGGTALFRLMNKLDKAGTDSTEALAIAKESKEIGIDALEKLNAHKLHVAQDYISLAAFEKFETRLFGELETIKNKLDQKADK